MAELAYPYFSLYTDKSGHWRWRLMARNHKILADSAEGYINKQDALRGIALVKGATAVWDEATRTWV